MRDQRDAAPGLAGFAAFVDIGFDAARRAGDQHAFGSGRHSDFQSLDHTAVDQMLLHNLIHVFLIDVGVPDFFGVDHHYRAFVAAVEATGHVDAHFALAGEFQRFDFILGVIAYLARAMVIAAVRTGVALVAAKENMPFKITHDGDPRIQLLWQ
jgi:hypothetical protein